MWGGKQVQVTENIDPCVVFRFNFIYLLKTCSSIFIINMSCAQFLAAAGSKLYRVHRCLCHPYEKLKWNRKMKIQCFLIMKRRSFFLYYNLIDQQLEEGELIQKMWIHFITFINSNIDFLFNQNDRFSHWNFYVPALYCAIHADWRERERENERVVFNIDFTIYMI